MKKVTFLFLSFLCLFAFPGLFAQKSIKKPGENNVVPVLWNPVQQIKSGDGSVFNILSFKGSIQSRDFSAVPYLIEKKQAFNNEKFSAEIEAIETAPLSNDELLVINSYKTVVNSEFYTETYTVKARSEDYYFVNIQPVRKNRVNGNYEKLISYSIKWKTTGAKLSQPFSPASFASSSVLATGTWYKIAIANTGIHKIDKTLLTRLGIDVTTLNPSNIK